MNINKIDLSKKKISTYNKKMPTKNWKIKSGEISGYNRKKLLRNLGYENLAQARSALPNITRHTKADTVYDRLRTIWNTRLDTERRETAKAKQKERNDKRSIDTQLARWAQNPDQTFDFKKLNKTKLKHLLQNIPFQPGRNQLLKIGADHYTLTPDNVDRFVGAIDSHYESGWGAEPEDSWVEAVGGAAESGGVSISTVGGGGGYGHAHGGWFKYYNESGIDLREFQIFTEYDDDEENENMHEHCFIYCLRQAGIENKVIQAIKRSMQSVDLPMNKLKQIAEEFNLYITVRRPEDKSNLKHYGDKSLTPIPLGLIADHYINIKTVPFTKYYLEHFEELKDVKDGHKVYDKRGWKTDQRFISSYDAIRWLVEHKDTHLRLIPMRELYKTVYYVEDSEITDLSYTKEDTKKKEYVNKGEENEESGDYEGEEFFEEEKEKKEWVNVFFDFETITENGHKSYLCVAEDRRFIGTEGRDCGRMMLDWLYREYQGKNVMLIAHNAGYDLRFILQYLSCIKLIERGKMLLRGSARYYFAKGQYINLRIQDSWSLISMPLKKFGKTFQLPVKKEIMPYGLYTEANVKKGFVSIIDWRNAIAHQWACENIGKKFNATEVKKMEYESMKNLEEWNCIDDNREWDKIDIIKYSMEYCVMDVQVLKQGYNKFQEWMMEITGLDINNYVSIASLADAYFTKEGAFEGVYEIARTPREFIYKCVDGGRTMTRQNKKWYVNKMLDDFDAVSLYPSAMARMKGYLMGKPKIIKSKKQFDYMRNKWDGYFVEIEVESVGIRRDFPLMNYKDEKGTKIWSNDMVGRNIFVDKTKLEDLIEFQKVEYKFIRGYYYDEGRNAKVNEIIKHLFEERKRQKRLKNPIQNVYKLLMNSSYGKTMMKPITSDTKYVKKENLNRFLKKYFEFVKEPFTLLPNGQYYKIKVIKTINKHYNTAHCGCEILSMSKRIMNEVMCLAEDCNMEIYYQDTDSMHIESSKIKGLSDEYRKKYNRELIGEDMGQFHTDFESDIIKKNIHSKESYFLGKKCYIDLLFGEDDNGNEVYDHHIRMKGVSCNAILDYCDEKETTPMGVYGRLFDREHGEDGIGFDLGCRFKKVNFQYNRNMSIENRLDFTRNIKFMDEGIMVN